MCRGSPPPGPVVPYVTFQFTHSLSCFLLSPVRLCFLIINVTCEYCFCINFAFYFLHLKHSCHYQGPSPVIMPTTPSPSTCQFYFILITLRHSVLSAGSDSWAPCSFTCRLSSAFLLSLVVYFLFTFICSVSERSSERPFSGEVVPKPQFDA